MLNDDGRALAGGHPRFESAWERYMIAEQRSLVARAEGMLGRSLIGAPPGESQEELYLIAEEDRRLAREGLVELMDEEGETHHKHIDELEPWDVADRVRAQTARASWLASRTQQRIERHKARRLSGLDGARRTSPGLSRRQLQILKHAARGLPNRLIAERVNLSESTVKRHLANIYEKIGVGSRSAAVAKGLTEGWLALEDMSPDGAQSAGRRRCRFVAEGCSREVLVVRDSREAAYPGPPRCYGHEMGPVGSPVPKYEGAREGSEGSSGPSGLFRERRLWAKYFAGDPPSPKPGAYTG